MKKHLLLLKNPGCHNQFVPQKSTRTLEKKCSNEILPSPNTSNCDVKKRFKISHQFQMLQRNVLVCVVEKQKSLKFWLLPPTKKMLEEKADQKKKNLQLLTLEIQLNLVQKNQPKRSQKFRNLQHQPHVWKVMTPNALSGNVFTCYKSTL